MLTLKEIAADWNCTPQYVSLCVKQGCPKDTFENARLWRQAHTSKQGKKDPYPSPRLIETPAVEFEKDPELSELFQSLKNSAIAAQNAWHLLDEAFLEKRPSKISVMLNLHSKAVEARVKTERMVQDVLVQRKILIPMTEAKTSVRRVVEIIVSRLSAMPQNIAPRCNPHNPEHAMEILQEECTGIIADAQKASIA